MRKFFVLLGILVAAFLVVVLGMGLFLMLAPGSEIFGIKYVKNLPSTSAEETKKYDNPVTGDLVFDTMGVPITIEFRTDSSFEFEFVQKFNGFTRSKIECPSLSVGVNEENGNLEIKTAEFKKFLWGTNKSGYYLNCKIPSTYAGHIITITSESSNVNIGTSPEALAEIENLTIISKGAVSLSGNLELSYFGVSGTKKNVYIPSEVSLNGDVTIECNKKSATIETAVGGLLKFNSNGGSLNFVSASSLDASTNGGSVVSSSKGVSVQNDAKASTGKGRVSLQYVGGALTVWTKSGTVEIGQNESGTVAGVAGKTTIETKSGYVYLKGEFSETELVKIQTSSGKIYIGDNNRAENAKLLTPMSKIGNLEISSSRGEIIVEQADHIKIDTKTANVVVGKYNNSAQISTTSGDVNVSGNKQLTGSSLVVSTGKNGNVHATNLSGETTINAAGSIYAEFTKVSKKIEINGSKKSVDIILPKTVNETTNLFWVESAKTSADIKLDGLEKYGKVYHSIDEVPEAFMFKLIKVTSWSGKITIKSAE